jgi:sigma-B regulation protein RsbU (phosphoserine phosphatase)
MTLASSPHEILSPSRKKFQITVLLIDDQAIIGEAVRRMLKDQPDIVFHYCSDPTKALSLASEIHPTVILQDLVMPDIDGLTLVKFFRANPATKEVPLIVLSSKEEPTIKAEAFALGANDYMVKLPDKVELIARIRYHSAAYIRLLERNLAYEKLEESQKMLKKELAEAAQYVKSLLPEPLTGPIITNWRFIPSTMLGGDAFGYHWLDDEHFAVYLLDVCGHGVGAAVLSISAMNVMRSQSLPNTDFRNPSQVLNGLNEAFQMENHNNMFFTIWYGVYNKTKRQISFASGAHPAAVLLGARDNPLPPKELGLPGLVIGAMPGVEFQTSVMDIGDYKRLFVFSDGIYEIEKKDRQIMRYNEFVEIVAKNDKPELEDVERIVQFAQALNGPGPLEDDCSIVSIEF